MRGMRSDGQMMWVLWPLPAPSPLPPVGSGPPAAFAPTAASAPPAAFVLPPVPIGGPVPVATFLMWYRGHLLPSCARSALSPDAPVLAFSKNSGQTSRLTEVPVGHAPRPPPRPRQPAGGIIPSPWLRLGHAHAGVVPVRVYERPIGLSLSKFTAFFVSKGGKAWI